MRALLDRYLAFFRQRGVARFTLFGLAARMPIGTVGLATLLHLREITGSIAFAGAVVGMQMVAIAATAPVLGRLIDIRGPRGVLTITGSLSPLAMLLVFASGDLHLPRAAIAVAAIASGALAPPVTVVIRTLWRYRFDDEGSRRTAFAIDGVLLETAYTVGPALIAAVVALASARWAYALAWIFVVGTVPILFASGGLHWWKQQPAAERQLLGPLHDARLVAVYIATFFLTMAFGALEVGYPGFATAQGSTPWGPALIAINSIGSAIGGIVYGGLHARTPAERQLPLLLALFAAPVLVHTAIGSIPWMMPWALLAGVMIAPSMTAVTMIVSREAPAKYATEAFTWSSTAILTGIGAGMAITGTLVERIGPAAAFAFAACMSLAAAALALRVASRKSRHGNR